MSASICRIALALAMFSATPAAPGGLRADQTPPTGVSCPEAAPFDNFVIDLIDHYQIPGASLAVSRHGQLVITRGYGYADVDEKVLVQPESLFRIASVSKPITAVAVLKLVEQGKLRLDDRAFDLLKMSSTSDPRISRITLRQLLLHSAGWDRSASFDPMFHFGSAGAERIIAEMVGRRLDFDPGSRHAYSNFGYCVLGRVIERTSGMRYEEFVQREVLAPLGISSMQVGQQQGNGQGEVHYHGGAAYNLLPQVMDAHGGWLASASDLVRFADAVQGRNGQAFLQPETLSAMTARPGPPLSQDSRHWYALGWNVVQTKAGLNVSHSGAMPGTAALLVCTHHGFSWALLCNRMPSDLGAFFMKLDRGLWEAARAAWP